jgi:hypothetical protein
LSAFVAHRWSSRGYFAWRRIGQAHIPLTPRRLLVDSPLAGGAGESGSLPFTIASGSRRSAISVLGGVSFLSVLRTVPRMILPQRYSLPLWGRGGKKVELPSLTYAILPSARTYADRVVLWENASAGDGDSRLCLTLKRGTDRRLLLHFGV